MANPLKLSLAVSALAMAAGVLSSRSPRSGWPGPLTWHGPRLGNSVALTFDDGPHQTFTPPVLDILDAYGATATFFEVGQAVEVAPGVVEDTLKRGHLVANHSYSHRWVDSLAWRYGEIEKTDDAFQRHFGLTPAFYRPPHGIHSLGISRAVVQNNRRMVTWDVMAYDWKERDPDVVARSILAGVQPGSIILLHDGGGGDMTEDRSVVVAALPKILEGLGRRSLEPVRLDALLGGPGYVEPWAH